MSRIDKFGIARQTAGKGAAATTVMDYFIPVESVDENQEREEITVDETLGNRFPTGLDYGTRFFRVPVNCAFRMNSVPRLLSGFLGQPTTAGVGPYTHTFDPTAAGKIPEWMSMYLVRRDPATAIVDLFYNARGEEMEIVFEPNQAPRLNGQYIALDLDDTRTDPTATVDSSERQKFYNTTVQIDTGAGLVLVKLARFAIRYTNNHDTDQAILGSRSLYDLPYGNADCEVEFSPRETLSTYYRQALLADPQSTKLILTATNGLAGAALRSFTWTVYACESIDAPASVSGAEVLKMVPVTARAKLDGAGKFVDSVVTNGVATY